MHIFVYMLLILNINKKGSYEFSKSCYTEKCSVFFDFSLDRLLAPCYNNSTYVGSFFCAELGRYRSG